MPLNDSTRSTCDTSPLLRFYFWKPVLFNTEVTYFPSDSQEERRFFVGISENFGHDMTFKILNISTNTIINRSKVRSDDDDKSSNLRVNHVSSPEVIT